MGLALSMTDELDVPATDIVLKIDFLEGGSAARPFLIAADLIRALENIDEALIKSVDSAIETALIVEDLQKSSIKVFLKNVLNHADDDALKTLDWKPLVGQYLVKAKYAAIRWLDSDEPKIRDLTEEVARLAKDAAEINHMPLPAAPNPARLSQALDGWQKAKSAFRKGEGLVITLDSSEYRVDLDSDWLPSETVEDIEGERELVSDQQTILMVRKPDMLGNTAWQFRLGKKNLTLQITDEEWLVRYRSRQVVLLPGDAVQVTLRTETKFDERGELLEMSQSIVKVIKELPQSPKGQEELKV